MKLQSVNNGSSKYKNLLMSPLFRLVLHQTIPSLSKHNNQSSSTQSIFTQPTRSKTSITTSNQSPTNQPNKKCLPHPSCQLSHPSCAQHSPATPHLPHPSNPPPPQRAASTPKTARATTSLPRTPKARLAKSPSSAPSPHSRAVLTPRTERDTTSQRPTLSRNNRLLQLARHSGALPTARMVRDITSKRAILAASRGWEIGSCTMILF